MTSTKRTTTVGIYTRDYKEYGYGHTVVCVDRGKLEQLADIAANAEGPDALKHWCTAYDAERVAAEARALMAEGYESVLTSLDHYIIVDYQHFDVAKGEYCAPRFGGSGMGLSERSLASHAREVTRLTRGGNAFPEAPEALCASYKRAVALDERCPRHFSGRLVKRAESAESAA